MNEIADRYRRVAGRFTEAVAGVPDAAWEQPAPCEGWVARDVVGHLVEWVPAFVVAGGAPPLPAGPSVDDDPLGAWSVMSDGIQERLEDPAGAAVLVAHPYAGTHRFDDTIATFVTGDVLIHTWDLARATGQDETLDPVIVHEMLVAMEPLDEMLRESGQYGPRVEVPPDADEQTRLIAFTGRQP
jgi:uncharacterized protein (TIGR03086 family)